MRQNYVSRLSQIRTKKIMEFVELKQLVESNAKIIEALANESSQSMQRFEQRFTVLGNEISDLKDTVFTLAQIASDHEKR
jgi:hypothetical protein